MSQKTHTCLNGVESAEPSWWEHDAQRIPLARVCAKCRREKLATFDRRILEGYNQGDVDEPIEPSL